MTNLDTIPAPGPDWRKVTPHGHGLYRLLDGRRAELAYPDGATLVLELDAE